MGNVIQKVHLDSKINEATTTTKENKLQCRSPNNKLLLFDELHNHSFYIFPQKLLGIRATVSHKMARHTHLFHTANVDINSENTEKSYLLDVDWYGCGECQYPKSELSTHIDRLMASISLNPFEYFPTSNTLNFKKLALHYIADTYRAGIWTQNYFVGDNTILNSLCDPSEISKNCNHLAAEATIALSPSIMFSVRAKRSGFDNGFASMDTKQCFYVASRVNLESFGTVISTQFGEGCFDMYFSSNLNPSVQFAVAMQLSLSEVNKNSVKCGLKFPLPDDTQMSVAVDNQWKVEASAKKKISNVPVSLLGTLALNPNGTNNYNFKFGIGIEINLV